MEPRHRVASIPSRFVGVIALGRQRLVRRILQRREVAGRLVGEKVASENIGVAPS
jgi:hypothetical protein